MKLRVLLAALEDVKGTINFRGLKIRIENPRGSTRSGTSKEGKKWSVTMSYPYGEILGYDGVDGDPVDCFIGPDKTSNFVHVIHTQKPDGSMDEDKVMLGWNNAQQAKQALLDNYDAAWHYGGMDVLSIERFKEILREMKKTGHPRIIRARRLR